MVKFLPKLFEKCDIYFEDQLISKELLLQNYENYLLNGLSAEKNTRKYTFHTGSLCFDVVSIFAAAVSSFYLDRTKTENVLDSFQIDQLVILENCRYRWKGITHDNSFIDLELDGSGMHGNPVRRLPYEKFKNKILPYSGDATTASRIGIKKTDEKKRNQFLAYIFGVPSTEVPSVLGSSTVVVMNRNKFDDITSKIKIRYSNGTELNFLDFVTASYYTLDSRKL